MEKDVDARKTGESSCGSGVRDGGASGAGDAAGSPAVSISKVTRIDDPVASFDLTADEGANGSGSDAGEAVGGRKGGRKNGDGSAEEVLEARVEASLKGDIADLKGHLDASEANVPDLEDAARKAVVEAWKVADEHLQEYITQKRDGGPFDGFEDELWAGPLPSLLREIVDESKSAGSGSEPSAEELHRQVKRIMAAYESAVAALVVQEEVQSWVAGDLQAFETFLRETVDDGSGAVDVADIARKGVVEALDMARKTWDDDGDFEGFYEQATTNPRPQTPTP